MVAHKPNNGVQWNDIDFEGLFAKAGYCHNRGGITPWASPCLTLHRLLNGIWKKVVTDGRDKKPFPQIPFKDNAI